MDMPHDVDPQETREWVDAIDGVLEVEGADRAQFLIEQVIDRARRRGAYLPFSANTAYINTIPADRQPKMPGDPTIEEKIRNYARWNAMAMVVRANKHTNVGGHIASYASAATLYDVGFNHFWHPPSESHGGDLVFIQGHSISGFFMGDNHKCRHAVLYLLYDRISRDVIFRFYGLLIRSGSFHRQ